MAPLNGTITAALLVFGLILGVAVARFARARLLTRAAQQNSQVLSEPPPGRGLTRRREGGLAAFRVPVRAPYRFRKG